MSDGTQTQFDLEGIIVRQVDRRDKLKADLKALNESVKNILENDAQYQGLESNLRDAKIHLAERKVALMRGAEAIQLKVKADEARMEIKDLNEALSDHLKNWSTLTGQLQLDLGIGHDILVIKSRYTVSKEVKKEE